jgi:hypothetical protein
VKLATFTTPDGAVRAGEVHGSEVHALASPLSVRDVLAGQPARHSGDSWSLERVELLAPVTAWPTT